MINNLKRIAASYKDPSSHVYQDGNGDIIRKVDPERLSLLRTNPFFAPVEETYEAQEHLYKIRKIPFISYYYEYPFAVIKDMALFYLDVLESVLKDGYSLSDGTPLNCTYLGQKKFEFFDIGSVVPFDKKVGWQGYRQFLTDFYFQLVYLSGLKIIYPLALVPFINDNRWFLNVDFSFRQKVRLPNLLFKDFINRSLKKDLEVESTSFEKDILVTEKSVQKIVTLLRSAIQNVNCKNPKTKWDDYYSHTILKNDYLRKKEETFKALYSQAAVHCPSNFIAADWGSNTGFFSHIMTQHGSVNAVIALESDHNAVSELYAKYKSEKIIPVHISAFNPTPAAGFNNSRDSLIARLSQCVQVQSVLGLIHHMQHEQNLSYDDIINFFASCSKDGSWLLIEYIDPEDDRYRLVRNPNYPFPEGLDTFMTALQHRYNIVAIQQTISTRKLFLAEKR